MPTGPKGERRPANAIESGIMVARIAVGDVDEEYVEKPESVPGRSKGGKKGGKARAEALTPERRAEIATQGAQARWKTEDTEGDDSPEITQTGS